MGQGTRIGGGNKRRVQVRGETRAAFSAERRQVFLDQLAGGCNVTRAAEAAGVGVSTVYDAKRSDAGFADQWAQALEIGYSTLEALLIERAAVGGNYKPGEIPVAGPETVDSSLALDLLRLHRAKAPRNPGGAPTRRASEKELNEAILARLDVLARRMKVPRRRSLRLPASDSRSGQASTSSDPARDERK